LPGKDGIVTEITESMGTAAKIDRLPPPDSQFVVFGTLFDRAIVHASGKPLIGASHEAIKQEYVAAAGPADDADLCGSLRRVAHLGRAGRCVRFFS